MEYPWLTAKRESEFSRIKVRGAHSRISNLACWRNAPATWHGQSSRRPLLTTVTPSVTADHARHTDTQTHTHTHSSSSLSLPTATLVQPTLHGQPCLAHVVLTLFPRPSLGLSVRFSRRVAHMAATLQASLADAITPPAWLPLLQTRSLLTDPVPSPSSEPRWSADSEFRACRSYEIAPYWSFSWHLPHLTMCI